MVDHAWVALRPRRLAVRAGSRRTAWRRREKLNVQTAHSRPRHEDAGRNPEQTYCAGSPSPKERERTATSGAAQILGRVNRCRSFADLEVQLRRRYVAGLPGMGDDLAALDGVAALDHDFTGVRI